jgi:CheY-like chemotaxis protein
LAEASQELDGLEAVRRIRALEAETGGATPIVMLTANARPERVAASAASAAAGSDRHLGKPITAGTPFEAIQAALGGRAPAEPGEAGLYPAFAHRAP